MSKDLGAGRRAPEPKSASLKANHRLLAWSGVLGGVIGFAMAMSVLNTRPEAGKVGEALIYGPLPAGLAIVLALLWGVVLPVISWRWHQVVDEHEGQAYRDGAVAGFYVMSIGAPVWWLLARADLLPPVDVVTLYIVFTTVAGLVWAWRKYR